MKKTITIFIILTILLTIIYAPKVLATTSYKVELTDTEITVNDGVISNNSTDAIYLANQMNNGGISENSKEANVAIANVINITSSGTYIFSGRLSNGQIAINTNNIQGEVEIVLDNAQITCEDAPAIFVYNTTTNSENCTVKIKTTANSTNTITGARLKQSIEGWSDQSSILYYIEKGYDDDDGSYYERYKYDGAISSDISLILEGEGTLTINGTKKEGIETKRNLTINSGEYIINSQDDGINACTDNESVITINGGSILINLQDGAEEGDGIDSNGSLYINGGEVYAFASEKSQDSGLDSDKGIYINGGSVVGIGNMADEVSNESKQSFMQLQFASAVSENETITITDENKNPITAFETDRSYTVLVISVPEMENGTYYVYKGGTLQGISQNGLYTTITSYTEGTQQEWSGNGAGMGGGMKPDVMMQGKMAVPEGAEMGQSQMAMPEGMEMGQAPEIPSSNVAITNGEAQVEFTITDTQHSFAGVTNEGTTISMQNVNNTSTTVYGYTLLVIGIIMLIVVLAGIVIKYRK